MSEVGLLYPFCRLTRELGSSQLLVKLTEQIIAVPIDQAMPSLRADFSR